MNVKLVKAITKVYNDYRVIENDSDLRRRRLSLSDYNAIPVVLNELNEKETAKTFIKSVADYFKKFGFSVTEDGVNYKIYKE